MNKARRKILADVAEHLAQLREAVEAARDEEQEYRDNMPPGIDEGPRADDADEAIGALEDTLDEFDRAIEGLQQAAGEG